MEISVQNQNSLKIRGKHAAVFINPQDKTQTYNAALLIGDLAKSRLKIKEDAVVIDGPGEYEAGGIKISGQKAEGRTVYSITLDNLSVVIGDLGSLNMLHPKLQEVDVAIIYVGVEGDVSFATSLATHALLFFGEKGREAVDKFAKDEKKVMNKYQITAEKFPPETETILLA